MLCRGCRAAPRPAPSASRLWSRPHPPAPAHRASHRRSDDRAARMVGQDGASPDPTTKLWMGGIDGNASAETVRQVFGR